MISKPINNSKHLTSACCILGTALDTKGSGFPALEDPAEQETAPFGTQALPPQRYCSLNNKSPPPPTDVPLYPGPLPMG